MSSENAPKTLINLLLSKNLYIFVLLSPSPSSSNHNFFFSTSCPLFSFHNLQFYYYRTHKWLKQNYSSSLICCVHLCGGACMWLVSLCFMYELSLLTYQAILTLGETHNLFMRQYESYFREFT